MKSEFKAKLIQHLLSRKNSEKGFTLIELLVVVVIIGILAAIALPTFLGQVNKARQAEARNFVATALKTQQVNFLEINRFGTNFTELQGEVGLPTDLTFYTPSLGGTTNPASGIAFVSNIFADAKRPTLKDYVGVAWAAQIGGATIPEVFTQVFEQKKVGTGNVANATTATNSATATAPADFVGLSR